MFVSSLPNGLSTLAHLSSLQLDGNPIRSIRRDILQGGTSRILRTLRDRSKDVKPSSADQTSVVSAFFDGDTKYPDKFQMKKTKALALGMKDLVDIPEEVFLDAQDSYVSNVDLSKNKLTRVPDGLEHLGTLISELSVSHNHLKTLPIFLSQFTKIQYINISSNDFTDLPPELGVLNTLRELNIANNKYVTSMSHRKYHRV